MLIENEANGSILCDRARLAANIRDRVVGLLGRRSFEPGDGLLLRPASAVHTVGMSMSIDVVGLDKQGRVVGIRAHLKPGRLVFLGWRTRSVLELPAGQSLRARVNLGDQLVLTD